MERVPLFVVAWSYNDDDALESRQSVSLDGAQWWVTTVWSSIGARLEPTSVTVKSDDGRPVTADLIRRLPIGTIHQKARAGGTRWANTHANPPAELGPGAAALVEGLRGLSAHRGVASSDDELKVVAAVYLKAWGNGEPVTAAVAQHFDISESTAGKRIMRARKAGLLDTARRITK